MQQAEVGEEVFHLAPLIEAHAADEFVGQAVAEAGFLERARLRVDAVRHDAIAEGDAVLPRQPQSLADDVLRLLLLRVGLHKADADARGVLREQVLLDPLRVAPDQAPRRVEDGSRRAVVLRKADDARVGVVLLEREDVADVGVAPRVDGLVRVAHDGEVAVSARDLARQLVLRDVRVLKLVHHKVNEPLLPLAERSRVLAEESDGLAEEVVEVDGAASRERALVRGERLVNDLVVEAVGLRGERLRPEQLRLRPADGGEDGARRKALGVRARLLHRLLHERHLILVVHNHVVAGDADGGAVAAENAGAERVKRPRGEAPRALPQQRAEPAPHLAGGPIRERHRRDAPRADAHPPVEIGEAVRDDPRLAGARPRDDQQRPVHALDGLPLRRIQPAQKRLDGIGHRLRRAVERVWIGDQYLVERPRR